MNLNDEIDVRPLWQWPLLLLAPAVASNINTFIDTESVYIKLLYGSLSLFLMWAGPALFQKVFRFSADIWQGKGMIRRDLDSGAKQCARIYLGRNRPSFLLAPLSFLFLKWTFTVGEVDMSTGSVSVGKMFVTNLVQEEKQCRSIGTNDVITGSAATHLVALERELTLSLKSVLDNDNLLSTIQGLKSSGLQIIEGYPSSCALQAAECHQTNRFSVCEYETLIKLADEFSDDTSL